eukprot:jgi/Tetstr1/425359/TSEL_015807.t1
MLRGAAMVYGRWTDPRTKFLRQSPGNRAAYLALDNIGFELTSCHGNAAFSNTRDLAQILTAISVLRQAAALLVDYGIYAAFSYLLLARKQALLVSLIRSHHQQRTNKDKILLISNRSAFPPLEYVMKQNGLTFCHVNNMLDAGAGSITEQQQADVSRADVLMTDHDGAKHIERLGEGLSKVIYFACPYQVGQQRQWGSKTPAIQPPGDMQPEMMITMAVEAPPPAVAAQQNSEAMALSAQRLPLTMKGHTESEVSNLAFRGTPSPDLTSSSKQLLSGLDDKLLLVSPAGNHTGHYSFGGQATLVLTVVALAQLPTGCSLYGHCGNGTELHHHAAVPMAVLRRTCVGAFIAPPSDKLSTLGIVSFKKLLGICQHLLDERDEMTF